MRISRFLCFACSIVLLSSCGNSNSEMPQDVIVKTGSNMLKVDEVSAIVPSGLSSLDSAEIAQKYIKKWITRELISEKALFNIGANDREINRLVNDYRNSLIIKKYKEELLEKKAEIDPTAEEIEAFYQKNKANYLLKKDLIEGIIVKVPVDAPKLKDLRLWLEAGTLEDLAEVESYSYQHASMYDDFRDRWIEFSKIEELFPEKFKNRNKALKNTDYLEQQDSTNVFLLKITNVKFKNDTAPPSYVTQNITTILRHKKKLQFFKTFEKDIYNEGVKNETVIYNPLYE